jgi:hypothetical protein
MNGGERARAAVPARLNPRARSGPRADYEEAARAAYCFEALRDQRHYTGNRIMSTRQNRAIQTAEEVQMKKRSGESVPP